jgi:uncharacterized protein YjfI (DUF2170 family)
MKSGQPTPRPSAANVRAFRERLRQQGLVKKDVWIRPEYAEELRRIETALRQAGQDPASHAPADERSVPWTVATIEQALLQTSTVRDGLITVDRIEGSEPSLHLLMHEYGDLSVYVAVGGEQIIVEAYLWPVAQVARPDAFNEHVLRTHKLLPLSTISLQNIAGVPSYTMFGALDTHSSLPSLMFEIATLADNVIGATEAYAGFLAPTPRGRRHV